MAKFKSTTGNDSFIGTAEIDSVSYATAVRHVFVDLNWTAPQQTVGSGLDTLLSIENATGSNFDDTLVGSSVANVLDGGKGNDMLYGNGGDDKLSGGDGDDYLEGGAGNDQIIAGNGNDIIRVTSGADKVDGGTGYDALQVNFSGSAVGITADLTSLWNGGTGTLGGGTVKNVEALQSFTGSSFNDTVKLGDILTNYGLLEGNDIATGGKLRDVIFGDAGNDTLNGGGGDDQLWGGADDDILAGGTGDDQLEGGAGTDTAVYAGPRAQYVVYRDMTGGYYVTDLVIGAAGEGKDHLVGMEKVKFSDGLFDLSAIATAAGDLVHVSGDGAGSFYPAPPYADRPVATAGNDVLTGSALNDIIITGAGSDSVDAGAGNDIIAGRMTSFDALGATVVDTDGAVGKAFAVRGGDTLNGGAGDDEIYAGYDSIVNGGSGNDLLHASLQTAWEHGAGNSILTWYNGLAVNVDLGAAANGTVVLQAGGLGNLSVTTTNVERFDIVFGDGNDVVTGGAYADTLDGGNGNDTLHGAAGDDVLKGGGSLEYGGNNWLYGDDGNDQLYANIPGSSSALDNFGEEFLYGGSGNDYLTGGVGDLLDGGAGDDWAALNLGGSTRSYTINLDAMLSGSAYNLGDADPTIAWLHNGTRGAGIEHLVSLRLGSGNDVVSIGANKIEEYAGPGYSIAGTGISLGDGNDTLTVNGTLSAVGYKPLAGEAGNDTLILNGDYLSSFGLGNGVAVGFETLKLLAGHNYSLAARFNNAFSLIDASALGVKDALTLDWSAPVVGATLISGKGADSVTLHDQTTMPTSIDLGDGKDIVILDGNFANPLDFAAHQLLNVETIAFGINAEYFASNVYNLRLADNMVGAGKTLTIGDASMAYGATIKVDSTAEHDGSLIIYGGTNADTLIGGDKKDQLFGGAGADVLNGHGGADTLTGGLGSDIFLFDNLSTSANKDSITDFGSGQDKIAIDRTAFAAFAGATAGAIDPTAFTVGASASTAAQHLIYNSASGALFYDADGVGGAAQIQIALLNTHPALTSSDFILA